MFRIVLFILLAPMVLLAGCATLSEGQLADEVSGAVERAAGVRPAWRRSVDEQTSAAVKAQLANGVTADSAVAVALLTSPDIQVTFAKLGLARADYLHDANPTDPVVGWSRQGLRGEPGSRVEWNVMMSLTELLTLPVRRRAAARALDAARLTAADELLGQIAAVRAAWLEAAIADRLATLAAERGDLARLEAELMERYVKAGNEPQRELHEARLRHVESERASAAAAEVRVNSRLQLARLMGLGDNESDWELSGEIAPLPADDDVAAELEAAALANRPDVQAAKLAAEARLAELRGAGQRRLIPELTGGYGREREPDGEVLAGPELEWQIPLFSAAQLALAGSRAEAGLAVREAQAIALDAVREVRAARERVQQARAAFLLARDVSVPSAAATAESRSKEFFFMLIGPFEAMQARAAAMTAEMESLEAAKHYWQARLELSRAAALPLQSVREWTPEASR